MRRSQRALLFCGLAGLAYPAWTATTTSSFGVSGTVVPTCSVSATALNVGAAIPINSNVDAQSTVSATCLSGASYTIGPNTLAYSLFTDPARTAVWGDGTGGSIVFNGSGNGSEQAIPVYGRILAPQSVPTGAYSDTIVVTLTF